MGKFSLRFPLPDEVDAPTDPVERRKWRNARGQALVASAVDELVESMDRTHEQLPPAERIALVVGLRLLSESAGQSDEAVLLRILRMST